MTPQRRIRAKLLRDWEVVKHEIFARDKWVCQTCGREATCVNHILGRKYRRLFLDPRYLISSCNFCNQSDVADTVEARQERIKILFIEWDYDYSDCPDKVYLEGL